MIARIEELSKETEQGRKEFDKRGNYLEDVKKRQAQLKETKEKFVNNRKSGSHFLLFFEAPSFLINIFSLISFFQGSLV